MLIPFASGGNDIVLTAHKFGFRVATLHLTGEHPVKVRYLRIYEQVSNPRVTVDTAAVAAIDVIADAINEGQFDEALIEARTLDWRPSDVIVQRIHWVAGATVLSRGPVIAHALWNDLITLSGRDLIMQRSDLIEIELDNISDTSRRLRAYLVVQEVSPEEIASWKKAR